MSHQKTDPQTIAGYRYRAEYTNARYLLETECNGSYSEFARRIERHTQSANAMLTENPTRGIGPHMARHIEQTFNKPRGWLSERHEYIERGEFSPPVKKASGVAEPSPAVYKRSLAYKAIRHMELDALAAQLNIGKAGIRLAPGAPIKTDRDPVRQAVLDLAHADSLPWRIGMLHDEDGETAVMYAVVVATSSNGEMTRYASHHPPKLISQAHFWNGLGRIYGEDDPYILVLAYNNIADDDAMHQMTLSKIRSSQVTEQATPGVTDPAETFFLPADLLQQTSILTLRSDN